MGINWKEYQASFFYDELINKKGNARLPAKQLATYLQSLDGDELYRRQQLAEATIQDMGITFTVYTA